MNILKNLLAITLTIHTIKPDWPDYRPSEISISQNLEECLSENPETKITPSPFGKTLEYRVVETFDIIIN